MANFAGIGSGAYGMGWGGGQGGAAVGPGMAGFGTYSQGQPLLSPQLEAAFQSPFDSNMSYFNPANWGNALYNAARSNYGDPILGNAANYGTGGQWGPGGPAAISNYLTPAQQQQLAQQQAQAQGPAYADNLQSANYLQMANQGYPNVGGNAGLSPGYQPRNVQYPTLADQTKQVATGQPTIGGQGGLPPDYGTATPSYGTSNVARTNEQQAQHIQDIASQMGISVQEAYNLYGGQMATAYEEAYDPLLQATTEGRQFLLDAARRSSGTIAGGYQQSGQLYGTTGQQLYDMMQQTAQQGYGTLEQKLGMARAETEPWRATGTQALGDLYNLTGTQVAQPGQYQQSPGYQFQLEQGANALQQAAAARGGLRSGKTLQDLLTFSQGTAAQDYNNWWNQQFQQKGQQMGGYESMAGMGAGLAGTLAGLEVQGGAKQADVLQRGAEGASQAQQWGTTGQAQGILGATQATAAGQQAYGDISAQSGQQYAQYLSDMIMGGRSAQAGAGLEGTQAWADILMSGMGLQSNYLSNAALARAQQGGGSSATDWLSLLIQGAGLFI